MSYAETGPDEILYVPLGGTGEIGMNVNLYGHDGRWLMVDLGITFARDDTPGVDLILPDLSFIEAERKNLEGLVVTHAHEDHIGAIPYLWRKLRCPIYATAFTATLIRSKLADAGLAGEAPVTVVPAGGRLELGPFKVEYVTMTHSIPEPNLLAIRTGAGTLIHSGDWKLDDTPVLGPRYDQARLEELGKESVLALVCDSTNVLEDGREGSERDVREALVELVGEIENRVVATCFASNVSRLASLMHAARANGRQAALVGRSMHRIYQAARENGLLGELPEPIDEREAGYVPREELLICCTGSQGEPRAALWRMAQNDHPNVTLDPGDTVLFSSRVIPGNERAIFGLQNLLTRQGLEVITDEDEPIHVSGHPARDELTKLYGWLKPEFAIPTHGEPRHLAEHAALARELGVKQALEIEDGEVVRLRHGSARVVDQVQTGRFALDGSRLVPVEGSVMKSRRAMLNQGLVTVMLVLDRKGELAAEPRISFRGVLEEEQEGDLAGDAVDAVTGALGRLNGGGRKSDEAVREAARRAARRFFNLEIGKKPMTDVEVIRLP